MAGLLRAAAVAVLLGTWPVAAALAADDWKWLEGTYWFVPKAYLPALGSSPGLPAPISLDDQTVYHIDGYSGGYFWGNTAVSYVGPSPNPPPPSCLFLVGSVTPEGRLHLTFTPLDASSSSEATVGIGTMTKQNGEWTMENQMSSPAGKMLLVHWAYMHQCKRGDHCYSSLPGVGVSIPEFLGNCTGSAQQR